MSSRTNPQEYQILKAAKFEELCKLLGLKELCCLEPDKKVIEKGFRKKALKCHPDKGGDPVEFKKLNDAYNRLIGHIEKLDQQAEAIELANSILIEISKTAVPKWHEKLKTRYGWFKSDNCKNILFDGPYKQYMGRSKNTGNLTIVLYEDPPDAIPKIHIRTKKYMAWIAEQGMPVHMHVDKGRAIQFDQWRIAHLAEFGISTFVVATPATERKQPPKKEPKTPKAKRKGREDPENNPPKARRDSAPTPEPDSNLRKETECTEPSKQDNVKNEEANSQPQSLPKKEKETVNDTKNKSKEEEKMETSAVSFQCNICMMTFTNMVWYTKHQQDKSCTQINKEPENQATDKNNNSNTNDMNGHIETDQSLDEKEKVDTKTGNTDSNKSKMETSQEEPKNVKTFDCFSCNRKFTNVIWLNKHLKSKVCMDNDSKPKDSLDEVRRKSEKVVVIEDIKKNDNSSNLPSKTSSPSDKKEKNEHSEPKPTFGNQTPMKETSNTGSLKSKSNKEDKKNYTKIKHPNDTKSEKPTENKLPTDVESKIKKESVPNETNLDNSTNLPSGDTKGSMENVETKQKVLGNSSNLSPKENCLSASKEKVENVEPKQIVLDKSNSNSPSKSSYSSENKEKTENVEPKLKVLDLSSNLPSKEKCLRDTKAKVENAAPKQIDKSSVSPPKSSCFNDIKEKVKNSEPKQNVLDQTKANKISEHKPESFQNEKCKKYEKNTDDSKKSNDKENENISQNIVNKSTGNNPQEKIDPIVRNEHVTKADLDEPMEVDDENKEVKSSVLNNKVNSGGKLRKKGVSKKSSSQEPLPTAKPSSDMAKFKKTVENNQNNNSKEKYVENSGNNEISSNTSKSIVDDKLVRNKQTNVKEMETWEKEEVKVDKLTQQEPLANKTKLSNGKEPKCIDMKENNKLFSSTSTDKSKPNDTCNTALKHMDKSITKYTTKSEQIQDKVSKPGVTFNLVKSEQNNVAQYPNLDHEAIELSNGILSTSSNECKSDEQETTKDKVIPLDKINNNKHILSKSVHLKTDSNNTKVDMDAIKITNDILNSGTTGASSSTGPIENTAPKSILKKPSNNEASKAANISMQHNIQGNSFGNQKEKSNINIKVGKNSNHDDNVSKLPITSIAQSKELSLGQKEKIVNLVETAKTIKSEPHKLDVIKEHSIIKKEAIQNPLEIKDIVNLDTNQRKVLSQGGEIKESTIKQKKINNSSGTSTNYLNTKIAPINNLNVVSENKIKQQVNSISIKQKEFVDPSFQTNSSDNKVKIDKLKSINNSQMINKQIEVDKPITIEKKSSTLPNATADEDKINANLATNNNLKDNLERLDQKHTANLKVIEDRYQNSAQNTQENISTSKQSSCKTDVTYAKQIPAIEPNQTKLGTNSKILSDCVLINSKSISKTELESTNLANPSNEKENKTKYEKINDKETKLNKIDLKHTKQYLVVNSPVSPQMDKKVMVNSPLSPSMDKKVRMSTENANKEENKSTLGKSLILSEKETKSRKLYFEPQALTDKVDKTKTNLSPSNDLKDNLERLDQKHTVNLKVIEDRYKNSAHNTKENIQTSSSLKTEPDITKSGSHNSANYEKLSDFSIKTSMKVPEHSSKKQSSPKKTVTYANESFKDKNSNNNSKLIDEMTKSSKPVIPTSSLPNQGNSNYSDISAASQLEADLRKLDQNHATKLHNINNHFENTYKKPIQLSSDPHANRPSTLGSSRFENANSSRSEKSSMTSKFSTPMHNTKEQYVPKRNETVHNIDSLSSHETTNKKLPLSKSTTSSDFQPKSEYLRRKFDRNFNASPEPFSRANSKVSSSPVSDQAINKVSNTKEIHYPDSKTKYVATSYSHPADSYKSTYIQPSSPVKSYPDVANSLTFPHSDKQSKMSSHFDMRAKSEGTTSLTNSESMQSESKTKGNFSLSTSASNKASNNDLYLKIQATREQHKVSLDRAKKYDPSSHKPVMITQKFPLPDGRTFHTNLNTPEKNKNSDLSEQKESRRMDRERNVMQRLISDRTARGKSDDMFLSKSASYRL